MNKTTTTTVQIDLTVEEIKEAIAKWLRGKGEKSKIDHIEFSIEPYGEEDDATYELDGATCHFKYEK